MKNWSTYVHELNRLPGPEPSEVRVEDPARPALGDLILPGAIVRTSYDSGPYLVAEATRYEYKGFGHWSLAMRSFDRAGKPKRSVDSWINDLVVEWEGDAPHFRTLFRDNDSEVFLVDGLDSRPEQELIVAPDGGDCAARGAGPGDDDNRREPVERDRPVRREDPMTETLRLTYRELGGRLGISPDAARMKAKREAGKAGSAWRLIPGNHPSDPVHVELPADAIPERPPLRPLVALDADEQIPMFPERGAADAPRPTKEGTDDYLARFAITIHGELTEANRKLLEETAAHGETKAALAGAEAELAIANSYVDKAARALQERQRSWWRRVWG